MGIVCAGCESDVPKHFHDDLHRRNNRRKLLLLFDCKYSGREAGAVEDGRKQITRKQAGLESVSNIHAWWCIYYETYISNYTPLVLFGRVQATILP